MKLLAWTSVALACGSALALIVIVTPAAGQSVGGPQCMAGTTRDGQQRNFTFYVAPASVAALEARGFTQASCQTATDPLPEYRTSVCEAARSAPPTFKQGFERVHGISLYELCNLATQAGS